MGKAFVLRRLLQPEREGMFCEGESECTSEMRTGQFSIFGAIEEKECRGFWRAGTGAANAEECGVLLGMALFLLPEKRTGKFQVEGAGRISTAGAQEMQKQVVRDGLNSKWMRTFLSGRRVGRKPGGALCNIPYAVCRTDASLRSRGGRMRPPLHGLWRIPTAIYRNHLSLWCEYKG